jgi:hypothetical protein
MGDPFLRFQKARQGKRIYGHGTELHPLYRKALREALKNVK